MKRKSSKRAKGTGSIFFHEQRGVWIGRVPVGRTPKGKVRYAEKSHPEQAELVKLLATAAPPGPTTTVGQWLATWHAADRSRPNTLSARATAITHHLTPLLGPHKLAALTAAHIDQAAREWAAKGMAPNTVRLTLSVLNTAMQAAVRAGLIPGNPVRLARKPRKVKTRIDPFTVAEVAALVAEASKEPHTRVHALLLGTGCRVGEALALEVSDWLSGTQSVRITKTTTGAGAVGPPKSQHSVRTIRVPDDVVPALVAAVGGRESGPLFATSRGTAPKYSVTLAAWNNLLKRAGMRPRNPHQARHSVATIMISAGVPVGDVAVYLGDTVQTVVEVYLHATGVDPSRKMDEILKNAVKCQRSE